MNMNRICAQVIGAIALYISAQAAYAGVIATNNEYGVFGANSGMRLLEVNTHGKIVDLNILVSFSKCDDPVVGPAGGACKRMGNPYENEIYMYLTSPDGIKVDLIKSNTYASGGQGVGQTSVTFDDEGGSLGPRVAAGSFRPVGSLAAFDGIDVFGTWKLVLGDGVSGDPLEYYHSALIVTTADAGGTVPEPAPLGLLAAGLGGWIAARRGRSSSRC